MATSYDQRNSTVKHNELYFWTATINNWKHLLAADDVKNADHTIIAMVEAKEIDKHLCIRYYAQPHTFNMGSTSAKWEGVAQGFFFEIYCASVPQDAVAEKCRIVKRI